MSTQVETVADADAAALPELTYREAIRSALEDELAADDTVLLMGEDVAEAGGVFKTSEGLVERFGRERIRNTPICENGFVGVALGLAVTGFRPVVEIMFSDFLPTAGDAIVNELPKFRFMSGGQCAVPVTVRSIGGSSGRFGTQHSATGESWYMSLPGLKVVTAGTPDSAYSLLRAAIRENDPVLFFEHRGLYGRKGPVDRSDANIAEVGKAHVVREGKDVTIVATLLMLDRALQAATLLEAEGISAEVIDLRWLRPLDQATVEASVKRTGALVIVEEQLHDAGWGASLVSRLALAGSLPSGRTQILSLPDHLLVPYTPELEDELIPDAGQVAAAARAAASG
jgi:acetoin:2,6-dichlorophenolindophenol oxidoreductase subunit beta